MKTLICILVILLLFTASASATEWEVPEVPPQASEFMQEPSASFGEALAGILWKLLPKLRPDLHEALQIAVSLYCASILLVLLTDSAGNIHAAAALIGTVFTSGILLSSTNSLINLGHTVILELTEYNKLFLPVMTTALAASGNPAVSAALYTAAMAFGTFFSSMLSSVGIPLVYIYLSVSIASHAFSAEKLKHGKDEIKKALIWSLKTLVSLYLTFIGLTGIISGSSDAAKLKVTKAVISTMIPVLGGTLSNAADAVLLGAGLAKNAVGIYGIYAMLAIFMAPFARIGVHYCILKLTEFICGLLNAKPISDLAADFSSAMGFLLAMTGALSIVQLISTVCFLKGGSL